VAAAALGVVDRGQVLVLRVFLKTQAVTLVGVEVILVRIAAQVEEVPAVVRLLHYGKTELGW
jgi:hypothetical protein